MGLCQHVPLVFCMRVGAHSEYICIKLRKPCSCFASVALQKLLQGKHPVQPTVVVKAIRPFIGLPKKGSANVGARPNVVQGSSRLVGLQLII